METAPLHPDTAADSAVTLTLTDPGPAAGSEAATALPPIILQRARTPPAGATLAGWRSLLGLWLLEKNLIRCVRRRPSERFHHAGESRPGLVSDPAHFL